MAPLNPEELADELERLVRLSATAFESAPPTELLGTSDDEMVTATVVDGRVEIEIHALAKRRLDREQLAASVVQAVTNAENQARVTPTSLLEQLDITGSGVSQETLDRVAAGVRLQLARLPFRL